MYKEIFKLKEMLDKEQIPYDFINESILNGYSIKYPQEMPFVCSIIEHDGSYGHEQDLLEIMGLLTDKENEMDSVAGYLTAEDVFKRIKTDYEKYPNLRNLAKMIKES